MKAREVTKYARVARALGLQKRNEVEMTPQKGSVTGLSSRGRVARIAPVTPPATRTPAPTQNQGRCTSEVVGGSRTSLIVRPEGTARRTLRSPALEWTR